MAELFRCNYFGGYNCIMADTNKKKENLFLFCEKASEINVIFHKSIVNPRREDYCFVYCLNYTIK